MRVSGSLFIALLVTGCTATQKYMTPSGVEKDKLASVYIYRTRLQYQSLNPEKQFVFVDELAACKLGTGDFIHVYVTAGKHKIVVRNSFAFLPTDVGAGIEVSVEEQTSYFVRYTMEPRVFGDYQFLNLTTKPQFELRK